MAPVRRERLRVGAVPANSFLFVVATGIVAVGLRPAGFEVLSTIWFLLAAVGAVVCAVGVARRWSTVGGSWRTDLTEPGSAFGLLSSVAALAVLGICADQAGATVVSIVLLAVVLALWFVLSYLVPWSVLRAGVGRDLTDSVDATWLWWTVTAQLVGVLATTVHSSVTGTWADLLALVAVVNWSVGLGLALLLGCTMAVRLLRQGLTVRELSPNAWLVPAAVALSGLAAAGLAGIGGSALSDALRVVAAAAVPILWTFALWLVPPLLALGWWRHGVQGVPARYETALWSMVVAIGATAITGIGLGGIDRVPVISWTGHTLLWAAAGAWLVVATAGLVELLLGGRASSDRDTGPE